MQSTSRNGTHETPSTPGGSCFTSIAATLHWRNVPLTSQTRALQSSLSTFLSRDIISFTNFPQICSPHSSPVTSLDVDNTSEGRFLLCGSHDCTVSVFDCSIVGSDYYVDNAAVGDMRTESSTSMMKQQEQSRRKFHPVARSRRKTPGANNNISNNVVSQYNDLDDVLVPSGHSYSITNVRWYPVDSGIFLSSDAGGNILLWDTNEFTPASSFSISGHNSSILPSSFADSTIGIASMDIPKLENSSHLLLALGCSPSYGSITNVRNSTNHEFSTVSTMANTIVDDCAIRLCDIKSGGISHQLIGHGKGVGGVGGVNVVKWSPTHEFILTSGGNDGTIKFWDIRKSGSGACLFTCNRDARNTQYGGIQQQNSPDHQSSQMKQHGNRYNTTVKKQKKKRKLVIHHGDNDGNYEQYQEQNIGPGNYSHAQCSSYIQSHNGPVSALSFTPDGNYIVSASTSDLKVCVWDIHHTSDAILQPTLFLGPSAARPYPIKIDNIAQKGKQRQSLPFLVTQPGSESTATVWVGNDDLLLGYELHGLGGEPSKVLTGHLDRISSITTLENDYRLFTGCSDGMILAWGQKLDL